MMWTQRRVGAGDGQNDHLLLHVVQKAESHLPLAAPAARRDRRAVCCGIRGRRFGVIHFGVPRFLRRLHHTHKHLEPFLPPEKKKEKIPGIFRYFSVVVANSSANMTCRYHRCSAARYDDDTKRKRETWREDRDVYTCTDNQPESSIRA